LNRGVVIVMKTYEVKYHLCPPAGDVILMINTVD
jgi:hypothetical protein